MRTTDTQIEEIKGNKKGLKESNQTPSTKLNNNKIPKYNQIAKKLLLKLITTTLLLESENKYYLVFFDTEGEMHKIRLTKNENHYIYSFIKTHSKEILNMPEE